MPLGGWIAGSRAPGFTEPELIEALRQVREPLSIVRDRRSGYRGVALGGRVASPGEADRAAYDLLGALPALYPEWLGDRAFTEMHGLRFPYVAGAMANGIATADMVIAMARARMLGFFGAAGLSFTRVEAEIDTIQAALAGTGLAWGANLIHSPNEPSLEARVAELYIRRGVERVSASAYLRLTRSIVRYAYSGLWLDASGAVQRRNHVFAKISRAETARQFLSPAPAAMIESLVAEGLLTPEEGRLAARLPVAEDIIVEADSGGHTDNRPLTALFPEILALRNEIVEAQAYPRPIRVGAAGGLGTPSAVAAAFALGASFVLTGSVNQSAVESGLSAAGKRLLAEAAITDVMMAPAADMFELGVDLQVLRRGTMFGPRAKKLYSLYRTYPSLEAISAEDRRQLETQILGSSLDAVWDETAAFWSRRDPAELARAEADPRYRMALTFRWYLGKASRWAITGEAGRELDYQIWCGPAMGAFNTWVRGSFLEDPSARGVVQIALNLLEGAAVITRAHQLRSYGLPVPGEAFQHRPRPLS